MSPVYLGLAVDLSSPGVVDIFLTFLLNSNMDLHFTFFVLLLLIVATDIWFRHPCLPMNPSLALYSTA